MQDKKLEDCSREELISIIKSIKKQKKFGLVWEDKPEKVAMDCKEKLPVLNEDASKAIIKSPGQPTNIIIEGDNFHSLSALNYTHSGKIDIIYIDPPYNTGSKDFTYNDKIVDKEDSFRHSKWLSFMNKRLQLAKTLLKNDGLILISIDDNEQSQLKLLCDAIFGEQNFVETFIWEKNPNPTFLNKYSLSSAEYILCYAKNKLTGLLSLDGGIITSLETDAPLQNRGNPKRKIRIKSGMAKALFRDQHIKAGNYGLVDVLDDIDFKNNTNVNDFTIEGTFRMTQETLYERIENGEQLLFKTPRMSPRLPYSANTAHSAPLKTLWSNKYGTTQIGNNDIKDIFKALPFSYPKPVKLIKGLLSFKNSKDIVVLDFFAGSGTTGQAVLELNREDNGNRRFIICTNNENNIAEEVTYLRINTVITGERNDGSKYSSGIPSNLRYFKTSFIEKEETLDKLRRKLSPACEDMIRVREGIFNKRIDEDLFKVFEENGQIVGVIYDRFELEKYIDQIEKLETDRPVHLYVFSYDNGGRFDEVTKTTKHKYECQPIPEGVLEIYKKIFKDRRY